MGILDAVTSRETARYRTPEGEDGSLVAEPLTNYFAGRLRREGRGGQTAVGGFLGAVDRAELAGGLSRLLRKSAYTGGIDFFHQWGQRNWTLSGFGASSHITGDRAAITATQKLPYHYFQRPDAEHLELDTLATSLTGFAGQAILGRQVGRHWAMSGSFNTISPSYEISDLGFQRRADRIDLQASGRYSETHPGRFRRYQLASTLLAEHNYAWDFISDRLFLNSFVQLLNYWSVNTNVTISQPNTIDDRLTRGGPRAARPGFVSMNAGVSTDPRRGVVGFVGTFLQTGRAGSNSDWFAEFQYKPRPNLDLSLSPNVSFDKSNAQFLGRVPDAAAVRTYGVRYLFASVNQTTVALDTRVNYTFSPTLSLQVFAQPFLASGKFGPTKEFAEPGQYRFLRYGTDVGQIVNGRIYPNGQGTGAVSFGVPQPDFNIGSLRGNAVMKWDWRPGSTMYLAWQQTRNDFEPIGDFALHRDVNSLFGAQPDNILLLKISYWLNP
jgi:hypothetical protein